MEKLEFNCPIFKLKILLIKLRWQTYFKIFFLNEWEFYKSNFETRFYQLARFTKKLVLILYDRFLTRFSRHDYCIVFLKLIGVRCHTFGGESINSVWPNYHGISWWLVSIIDGDIVNLRMAFLVHFLGRGEWYQDFERYRFYMILVFTLWYLWLYYFIIIFRKLCF